MSEGIFLQDFSYHCNTEIQSGTIRFEPPRLAAGGNHGALIPGMLAVGTANALEVRDSMTGFLRAAKTTLDAFVLQSYQASATLIVAMKRISPALRSFLLPVRVPSYPPFRRSILLVLIEDYQC